MNFARQVRWRLCTTYVASTRWKADAWFGRGKLSGVEYVAQRFSNYTNQFELRPGLPDKTEYWRLSQGNPSGTNICMTDNESTGRLDRESSGWVLGWGWSLDEVAELADVNEETKRPNEIDDCARAALAGATPHRIGLDACELVARETDLECPAHLAWLGDWARREGMSGWDFFRWLAMKEMEQRRRPRAP